MNIIVFFLQFYCFHSIILLNKNNNAEGAKKKVCTQFFRLSDVIRTIAREYKMGAVEVTLGCDATVDNIRCGFLKMVSASILGTGTGENPKID